MRYTIGVEVKKKNSNEVCKEVFCDSLFGIEYLNPEIIAKRLEKMKKHNAHYDDYVVVFESAKDAELRAQAYARRVRPYHTKVFPIKLDSSKFPFLLEPQENWKEKEFKLDKFNNPTEEPTARYWLAKIIGNKAPYDTVIKEAAT